MKFKNNFTLYILIVLLGFIFAAESSAQEKRLTYNQVFNRAQPQLMGSLQRINGWYDDENYLINPEGKDVLAAVNVITGEETIIVDYSFINQQLPEGFDVKRGLNNKDDYSNYLFDKDNNLYYFSLEEQVFKQITDSDFEKKNPSLSPNGKFAAFTDGHNLFVADIEKETVKQLTNDNSETVYNGYASWVYYEEILGRGSRYQAYWWSPDGNKIAFLRFDDVNVPKFPLYRADGVHGELEWEHYPKAGDPNPKVRLGVADVATGNITWITEEEDQNYVAFPTWTNDSKSFLYQVVNWGQDNLKIYKANVASAESSLLYEESQPSWVNFMDDLYMLTDDSAFIIKTDKDGWWNFYLVDTNENSIEQITKNKWNAESIELVDFENKVLYFNGTGEESTESHLFKINLDGSGLTKITEIPGTHSVTLSPGGTYFFDRFSSFNTPPKLDLYSVNEGHLKSMGDSKLPVWDEYKLAKVELFRVNIPGGYDLPVKWYLPTDFDENKKYPVIISIYGGPGSKSVRNSFGYSMSPYYSAEKGIIFLSVDHRGSGHFGKAGEAEMHRNLGKWEMHDYIEIVKWLRGKQFIDETKIGINGGSYGGFVTALALTYGADYFTHGIAEFSVTDYRLYDNVYTERFMDKPEENPDGYYFTAAVNHAEKYKGNLLITHGTMDDNVHMQNSIQLISKLQDLNKDFEMMFYPNARHGIGYPKVFHNIKLRNQFWFKNFLDTTVDEIIASESN